MKLGIIDGAAKESVFFHNILVNFFNQALRVNSDKVQNVGQGQDLDHLRTPLIWTGWGHMVTVPNIFRLRSTYNMLHWAEYEGNLFFQVLAFFGPYLKWLLKQKDMKELPKFNWSTAANIHFICKHGKHIC